jgi:peptide deformylase
VIEVRYQDLSGAECEMKLTDFAARIFQHEYDHLQVREHMHARTHTRTHTHTHTRTHTAPQGVLFHDRMKPAELDKVRAALLALEDAYLAAHPDAKVQRLAPAGKAGAAAGKGFGGSSAARR